MNKGKRHSRSTDHLFYVFDDNSNIGAVRDSRLELLNQRLTVRSNYGWVAVAAAAQPAQSRLVGIGTTHTQ